MGTNENKAVQRKKEKYNAESLTYHDNMAIWNLEPKTQ